MFAEYKPIPAELSKQYKVEIEQIIDSKYKSSLDDISKRANDAHKMYLKVLQNKKYYYDYCFENFDMTVDTAVFNLYSTLLKTTNKYIEAKDPTLSTDCTGNLYDFLNLYFKANNVNTSKLNQLNSYARKKQEEILQEQENLHKFIYLTEND